MTQTVREWEPVHVNDSVSGRSPDWKYVESVKDSPVHIPLRVLGWVYTFDELEWKIAISHAAGFAGATAMRTRGDATDALTFPSAEAAKNYVEVLLKLEDA